MTVTFRYPYARVGGAGESGSVARRWKSTDPYPKGATFGELLEWHLTVWGTNPSASKDKRSRPWVLRNFAAALRIGLPDGKDENGPEKNLRNWRSGTYQPNPKDDHRIFEVLFGGNADLADWNTDLQEALNRAREEKRSLSGKGPRLDAQSAPIVRDLIDDIWVVKERRLKRTLARNVGELGFWRGEMLKHITNISDGAGSVSDLKKIEEIFKSTNEDIKIVTELLRNARWRLFNIAGGLEVAFMIDDIFDDRSGKERIREKIAYLVRHGHVDTPHAQELAKSISDEISRFNANLTLLHQTLLPS